MPTRKRAPIRTDTQRHSLLIAPAMTYSRSVFGFAVLIVPPELLSVDGRGCGEAHDETDRSLASAGGVPEYYVHVYVRTSVHW
jgi:hypothetical protein